MLAFWACAGVAAAPLALGAPGRLSVRGDPPAGTESAAVDSLLGTRFSGSFRDVLVVAIESPATLDSPEAGAVLDSLVTAVELAAWSDRVVSWRSTRDSST